jgi:hypothetical protein
MDLRKLSRIAMSEMSGEVRRLTDELAPPDESVPVVRMRALALAMSTTRAAELERLVAGAAPGTEEHRRLAADLERVRKCVELGRWAYERDRERFRTAAELFPRREPTRSRVEGGKRRR